MPLIKGDRAGRARILLKVNYKNTKIVIVDRKSDSDVDIKGIGALTGALLKRKRVKRRVNHHLALFQHI